jgi:HlyD family secretion protein
VDEADARAALRQAEAAVQQAQARLAQIDAVNAPVAAENARQAETLLAQARADLARLESLAAAGAVAAREVEDARRALAIADARRRAALAGETATIDSGAERRLAEAALAESRARRTAADIRLAHTRIEAPHDGVVLARHVETGDIVQPGTIVLDLAADAAIEVVIEPDERNLGWIRAGQQARMAADAYPDVPFDGEVTYIAPAVDPRRGSIEVRLTVVDPPSFLKPHMTVSVDLAVATRHAVLTLPSPAVQGGGADSPWVFVVDEGRLVRQMVTIGLRGDGHTEIVDGLREGDDVVLPDERRLAPGTRVRAERVAR